MGIPSRKAGLRRTSLSNHVVCGRGARRTPTRGEGRGFVTTWLAVQSAGIPGVAAAQAR